MFKHLVWISAITIALCAAFFSVTGIATLFSGKFFAVLAMASSLEIGKLVAASFLYRYWKKTAKLLRSYLIAGVVVLMVITSGGIYAYLSSAYAEIAATPQTTLNQITAVDARQATLNDVLAQYRQDNENILAQREQEQRLLSSVLEGETSLSQRSAFANVRQRIADLDAEKQLNDQRIANAIAERDSLETAKVNLNAELNTNSKIGTFIYIARALDVPLDTVVKWFVLIIVFVFDPLAVSLILAYNSIVVREQEEEGHDPGMEIMAKPFSKLRDKMSKEAREKADTKTAEWLDLDLPEPDDWEPINLDEEKPDTLDFDAIRRLKATKDILDLSDEIDLEDEEELEIHSEPMDEETAQRIKDWGDQPPFWTRPGYRWRGREKEWQRYPAAVKYYNEVIKKKEE